MHINIFKVLRPWFTDWYGSHIIILFIGPGNIYSYFEGGYHHPPNRNRQKQPKYISKVPLDAATVWRTGYPTRLLKLFLFKTTIESEWEVILHTHHH